MNFVSCKFWLFLLTLAGVYVLLRGLTGWKNWSARRDQVFLLVGSLILFGAEDLQSLVIFLAIAVFIYSCISIQAVRESQSRVVLALVVFLSLSPLLFYKYASSFGFSDREGSRFVDLAIPIGLSFYTFQLLSLFIDERAVSLGKGAHSNSDKPNQYRKISFLNYLNFGSFFPQIVAGPIERRVSLLPQLERFRFSFSPSNLEKGMKNITFGLFYKLVIADSLASSGSWITAEYESPLIIHLANICFGLRIYGDFAGYSFIAVGIAQLFGVGLTWNFQSPYTQTTIRNFWRSWHVSLTQWLRDYVYIPLGGKKVLWASFVTFLVSGIWHGAGWNFIVWGSIHGIAVSFERGTSQQGQWKKLLGWWVTLLFVMSSWLPFYQWSSAVLLDKIRSLFSPCSYLVNPLPELTSLCGGYGGVVYFAGSMVLGVSVVSLEWYSRVKHGDPYQWARNIVAQCVLIVLLVLFAPTDKNQFIYFSF